MGIVQNIIRVGIVSSVDSSQKAVRAVFPDRDNQVSDWLQIVIPPLKGYEIQMPGVGQQVLCIFQGNGLEAGFCLGTIGGAA